MSQAKHSGCTVLPGWEVSKGGKGTRAFEVAHQFNSATFTDTCHVQSPHEDPWGTQNGEATHLSTTRNCARAAAADRAPRGNEGAGHPDGGA